VEHYAHVIPGWDALNASVLNAIVGIVAGAVVLAGVHLAKKVLGRRHAAA